MTLTSKTFALGLFLSLGMTSAFAQSNHSSIHGTVLDPSGALIPKAQVIVTGADGFTRTLESDDAGAFELSNLTAGSYSVSINAAGFTPALAGVDVAEDKVAEESVTLGISVNQEIEVSAN
ncbi:carboxypeptidase-like regulatory domain-containing protein [Granulicella paludicola]|uniref:carboxypeptidase-like regulatory domain-containing protein n=1 Tax=Granulicella paludicola TaxID=474951 RepID=UPI0021DFCD1D|nr:carboxypeptidase-like regulatory domain-containing protein [Granulicella paludicola]